MYSLFINIGMVIGISVLSFYSDKYIFFFYVVDKLQAFGLAIITAMDPSSTPFFPLWIFPFLSTIFPLVLVPQ